MQFNLDQLLNIQNVIYDFFLSILAERRHTLFIKLTHVDYQLYFIEILRVNY